MIEGSEGNYYIEFDIENIKLVSASYSFSDSEANTIITKSSYDIIEFTKLNGRNGILSANNWCGKISNSLFMVSSSTNARITATKYGIIKLTVAPAKPSSPGKIQQNSGSNNSQQIVSNKMIISILATDMVQSGSNYYMDFSINDLIILSAKWEPLPYNE